jgi:hypothetical protein
VTRLRTTIACVAVAVAGCRAKPPAEEPVPPPPPAAAAKDDAPTFAAPPPADVARVAAEVAPLGGGATAPTNTAVPAVYVTFQQGRPKEAEVPDLVRRLTATGVPVTVVVPQQAGWSAAAYGQLLGVPNLRGLLAFGPTVFPALAAFGGNSALEYLSAGAPATPDDASVLKLRRLRVLSLVSPNGPGAALTGLDELPDLHTLHLSSRVRPADLPRVWRLTGLRELRLEGGDFGDADLAPLATMVHLRSVVLFGKGVTKESFAHLTDLPELTNPAVLPVLTGFTDGSLGHLGRMKSAGKIDRLHIGGSAVTGAGLAHLRTLTGLKELGLFGIPRAEAAAGLAVVAALPNLAKLDISPGYEHLPEDGTGNMPQLVTTGIPPAAAFEGLAGAVAVKSLRLTNATDAHLLHVGKMATLEELALFWQDVNTPDGKRQPPTVVMTDAGLAHLRAAPRLRKLSASGCRVTDAGLAHLAAFPALTDVELLNAPGAAPLTDAGTAVLATSKTLRAATVSGRRVELPGR